MLRVCLLLALAAAPAGAQTASDTWQVSFVPYLMGAGFSGTVGTHGLETDINVSASDVFANLEFGFMGVVAARKGAWGFGADAIYMGLGATPERPPVELDFNQTALAFYGLRQLSSAVDLTFGVRVNGLDGTVDPTGPAAAVATKSQWWTDPIVGIQLRSPEGRRAQFRLYTEVGGFGMGSDFAWQIFPTVGIRFSERAGLELGYRWLGADYETGDGADRFLWDTVTQGPAMGFTIRF